VLRSAHQANAAGVVPPDAGAGGAHSQYLEAEHAALHADTLDEVEAAVTQLLLDPAAAAPSARGAIPDRRAHAAETIAGRVLESIPGAVRKESMT